MQPRKKKKETISPGYAFFNNLVMNGVYRLIFSYITDNKDVFSFAVCCKNLWNCFIVMLQRSSVRYYRLNKLNNPKGRIVEDNSFEIFSTLRSNNKPHFQLDESRFVSSVEEFEEKLKHEIFFQILGDINKKYNRRVCMVSGGYILKHFYKGHKFRPFLDNFAGNLDPQDIDVFILGDNKVTILNEILMEMKKRFSNQRKFVIYTCPSLGMVNVEVRFSHFKTAKEVPSDIRRTEQNVEFFNDYVDDQRDESDYFSQNGRWMTSSIVSLSKFSRFLTHKRTRSCFQFLLHELHDSPGDVFAFFDLDCCKIGYFPGLSSLVCPLAFIRSLVTGINYTDLHHRDCCVKHFYRIRKYFRRTKIISTMQCEPLLSFYHTLDYSKYKDRDYQKFPKNVLLWKKVKQFGDIKSDGRYYNENIISSMKEMKQLKTLAMFRKKIRVENIVSNNPYLFRSVGIRKVYKEKEDSDFNTKRRKKKRSSVRYQYLIRKDTPVRSFYGWGTRARNVTPMNLGGIDLENLYGE